MQTDYFKNMRLMCNQNDNKNLQLDFKKQKKKGGETTNTSLTCLMSKCSISFMYVGN